MVDGCSKYESSSRRWLVEAQSWMMKPPAGSQCLLFFDFLWERCGERDLDFFALWSGDGDRERLDRLGDFVLLVRKHNDRFDDANAGTYHCDLWKRLTTLALEEKCSWIFGLQDRCCVFCPFFCHLLVCLWPLTSHFFLHPFEIPTKTRKVRSVKSIGFFYVILVL